MATTRIPRWLAALVPRSLFGRAFLSILLLSLLMVSVTGGWFYHRSFQMMDAEAEARLLAGARLLAHDLPDLRETEDLEACNQLLRQRFGAGQTLGWIQNVYWIDQREGKTAFLASFSVEAEARSTLLPPALEDVEELIDDGADRLDQGRPVFPDPFAQTAGRRFKIVLFPVLDQEGFLDSVVGLEADMEYLDLSISIRQTASRAALAAIPLCVLTSFLWARSFSRRIRELLGDLECVARREPVPEPDLGIRELDLLRRGLADLGRRLDARDRHLQEVHAEKLRELSLLGGAIAHEVRNPLSAIELHLGLLKRQVGASPAPDEAIREIQEQLTAMKNLVERFLNYSRPVTPQFAPVRLKPLCADVAESLRRLGHDFGCGLAIPEDLKVTGDETLLRQVLENLLGNAVRARPAGLAVEVEGERIAGMVRLTVTDNGPGVPPGIEPRLFTPFVSGRPDGFGIGLALSRKLVEVHGGLLSYRPAPGGGARFIIEIPEKA